MRKSILRILIHLRSRPLIPILLGAALLRLGLWWGKFGKAGYRHLFRDDEVYWQAAQAFLATGEIPSPKLMPILPLLEAAIGFPGIIYHNILVGVGIVYLVYLLGAKCFNERTGLIAAALAAISPGLLYFSNHAYTEVPFTFLLLLGTLLLYKQQYWGASIALVLSVLLRPTLDLLLPFWVCWFSLIVHREGKRFIWIRLGQYALVYLVCMSPWWAYNYERFGEFVRLNYGGGEVMYHGQVNLPQAVEISDPSIYTLGPYADIASPRERDEALKKAVRAYWMASPSHLPRAMWLNSVKFWFGTLEVFYGSFAYLAAFWDHALLCLGLVAIWLLPALRRRWWSPILLLFLYFWGGHSLLHGMPRYRLPLEPFLGLMVATLTDQVLIPGLRSLSSSSEAG